MTTLVKAQWIHEVNGFLPPGKEQHLSTKGGSPITAAKASMRKKCKHLTT